MDLAPVLGQQRVRLGRALAGVVGGADLHAVGAVGVVGLVLFVLLLSSTVWHLWRCRKASIISLWLVGWLTYLSMFATLQGAYLYLLWFGIALSLVLPLSLQANQLPHRAVEPVEASDK